MTMEWAAISAISALANVVMGIFMFMVKGNMSEREKRLNHFDEQIKDMLEKLNEHSVTLAVVEQKYDTFIRLLNVTDSTIKRLSTTLEGCRMQCNKTNF
jgi:hypothetical protein